MTPLALALLLHGCAPSVHPQTLAAIVQVESGGWPWAIGDNTAGRGIDAPDYQTAVTVARSLIARGHNLDLGLGQVNTGNLRSLGLTPAEVLQPCTNLGAAARILRGSYERAVAHFGAAYSAAHPNDVVLYAVSAYNTGSLFAGGRYVRKVVAAAFSRQTEDVVAISQRLVDRSPAPARVLVRFTSAPTFYEYGGSKRAGS
ncbi:hypothetical protein EPN42_13085 [bacterium]|nr:MAG: hypothetical protein EPN42_13085 [bacterium]